MVRKRSTIRKVIGKIPFISEIYILTIRNLFDLLAKIEGKVKYTYNEDGMITDKNADFKYNPKFLQAYRTTTKKDNIEIRPAWIAHIHHWFANYAKNLKGDFIECGVREGTTVLSNIHYINFSKFKNKKYYLFDTYCGLSEEFSTKKEYDFYKKKDIYHDIYGYVVKRFSKYKNVVIVKGPIPRTLNNVKIKHVAYLHIDMNCVFPEVEALKFFWTKMVKGGVIILDDYGPIGHEKQKEAHDNFAASVGTEILSLPTGQGVMIKS